MAQAAELRREMMAPGNKNIYQPNDTFSRSIKSFCTDQDVNRSLASLLLTPADAAALLRRLDEEVTAMNL